MRLCLPQCIREVIASTPERMTTNQRRAGLAILTVGFIIAAVAWTVGSAAALSHTFDEPHHLATGLEWWQFGTYRWWTENPPLPKVVTTLLPYLTGMRLPGPPAMLSPDPWLPGVELLEAAPDYARDVMLARLGTVAFLLLTLGLTFALAGGRKRLLPRSSPPRWSRRIRRFWGTPAWRRRTSPPWRRCCCSCFVSTGGPTARRRKRAARSARVSGWPRSAS